MSSSIKILFQQHNKVNVSDLFIYINFIDYSHKINKNTFEKILKNIIDKKEFSEIKQSNFSRYLVNNKELLQFNDGSSVVHSILQELNKNIKDTKNNSVYNFIFREKQKINNDYFDCQNQFNEILKLNNICLIFKKWDLFFSKNKDTNMYYIFFKIHKNIHFDLEEWRFFIKNNLII